MCYNGSTERLGEAMPDFAGHSMSVFLGETSDSWERPIPKDKTIHVEVFQNPETGVIEYFRHNMPFHMQLHMGNSEDEDG